MTTAARPTYAPARGGTGKAESDLGALSKQYSSRDLPAHTKLKYRQEGQSSSSEVKSRDFRKELEERERTGRDKSRSDRNRESGSSSSSSASSSKRPRIDQSHQQQQLTANLDADDPVDDDEDDDDDNDDDDNDDDDTAELLAELARIKKERAAETALKEAEKKAEEERIRMENILKGNPLITNLHEKSGGDFTVKRRWDDDVVFKNCARGESDKKERRFINDTLRSEFHKKFMDKYIK